MLKIAEIDIVIDNRVKDLPSYWGFINEMKSVGYVEFVFVDDLSQYDGILANKFIYISVKDGFITLSKSNLGQEKDYFEDFMSIKSKLRSIVKDSNNLRYKLFMVNNKVSSVKSINYDGEHIQGEVPSNIYAYIDYILGEYNIGKGDIFEIELIYKYTGKIMLTNISNLSNIILEGYNISKVMYDLKEYIKKEDD